MNVSTTATTVSYEDYKATVRSYFKVSPQLVKTQEKEITSKKDYFNPIEGKYRYNSSYDTIIQRVFKDSENKVEIRVDSLAIDNEDGAYDYYPLNFQISYVNPNTKTKAKKEYVIHYPANFKP